MEVKRHLPSQSAAIRHIDLNLNKVNRTLCTGNSSPVLYPGDYAPGSPYRLSAGSGGIMNVFSSSSSTSAAAVTTSKYSLSKELVQKLRSMTETIKILSEENHRLRQRENELEGPDDEESLGMNGRPGGGKYHNLNRAQLMAVTASYEEKLSALSDEIKTLKSEVSTVPASSDLARTAEGKDKYKTLARRLKEERNQYRETCLKKQNEQAELKKEIDRMSELIVDLRENCQKLHDELLESKNQTEVSAPPDKSDVGVQVTLLLPPTSGDPNLRQRKTSIGNFDSIKKAKSVYCVKQPKPRRSSTGLPLSVASCSAHNSSNSSSISSLKGGDKDNNIGLQKKTTKIISVNHTLRNSSSSPVKRSVVGGDSVRTANVNNTRQSLRNSGPKIWKSVVKPSPPTVTTMTPNSQTLSSPILAMTPLKSVSTPVSLSSSSRTSSVSSKIPLPGVSPIRRGSRIPSAPLYNTPQRTSLNKNPIPSPKPVSERISKTPEKVTSITSPPPPPPPTPRTESLPEVPHSGQNDEILCVYPDGELEIHPSSESKASFEASPSTVEQHRRLEPPMAAMAIDDYSQIRGCSGESSMGNNSSADDEGSRDGDVEVTILSPSGVDGVGLKTTNADNGGDSKMKGGRFNGSGKLGLAARRIQRTWKHFYQELENRKESSTPNLSTATDSSLVSVTEEDDTLRSSSRLISDSPTKATMRSHQSSPNAESSRKSDNVTDVAEGGPHDVNTTTDEDKLAAINYIEATILSHGTRVQALATLLPSPTKDRIHIARPWLKKRPLLAPSLSIEESSEDDIQKDESMYDGIQSVVKGHEVRRNALDRLEAGKEEELMISGKLSALKGKFNGRRLTKSAGATTRKVTTTTERSDGVTDDEDDAAVF